MNDNINKYKILLVGDSVFDNAPYVEAGLDSVSILRKELSPIATVDSVAIDGSTTFEVLYQLDKGELSSKPKYDIIFLSIGGNDLLCNQEIYLDPTKTLADRRDFIMELRKRFLLIRQRLLLMSENVFWTGVYKPYFDPEEYSEEHIERVNRAIHDINTKLKAGYSDEYMLSLTSILNQQEDFVFTIEPSAQGSEKLAKELKRIVHETLNSNTRIGSTQNLA